MKKINLLLLTLLTGFVLSTSAQYSFNICGNVTSTSSNTPAPNASIGGYITEGNGTVLAQFSSTTDSLGNYCTTYFSANPDSGGCAYLNVNISANIPGCNVSQTYTFYYWLCNDTTIQYNISGCDTTSVVCSAYISDSTFFGAGLTATGTGSAPFTYVWTNNNGTIYDTTQNIYPNNYGQYCVTVTDANGCQASDCYYYGQNNCNMSIMLVLDSTPCMGPAHSLGSWVSGGTAPYSYTWSTGDSSEFICNLAVGSYCLTVTDAQGCTVSDCYYLQSSGNCSVSIYQYADSSNNTDFLYAAYSGYGSPVSYQWQGNGAVLDTTDTYYPNAPGTYCVVVSDDSGCTATACYDYGIIVNQCYVYFSSYEDSSSPGTVYFYPYPGGTAPFVYYWTFSDGTSDTTEYPVHTFTLTNGWDYACLEITDANGCMSSYCDYVAIVDSGNTTISCYASFSGYFDDFNGTPGEIFFMDYSWGSNTDPVISWNWDFGDGTSTSSVPNPTHIYSMAGNYTICLTITDAGGCTSSYCETWYIDPAWWGSNPWGNGMSCDAQFVATQDSTVPGMVYLVDLSYGSNLFYTWSFVSSDGTISQTISTQYPFITFNQFGCFNVCLMITDTLGNCQDSYCDSICVDSLGNLNKSTNWGLTVIPSAMPASLFTSAKEEMKEEVAIALLPNPVKTILHVNIALPQQELVQVELVDITGRIIENFSNNLMEGSNTVKMNLSKYPEGIYFVKVNSVSVHHTEKIVKMN